MYKHRYALVIGISEYEDRYWSHLDGVNTDVKAVSDVLQLHGFVVHQQLNLRRDELLQAYTDFIDAFGQDEDTALLIYYAGHATTIESNGVKHGYLIPTDGWAETSDGFHTSALPMDSIAVLASGGRIRAKHSMFVFDACFSGSIFQALDDIPITPGPTRSGDVVNSVLNKPARIFITSGGDDTKVPDRSIFRDWFVKNLLGEGEPLGVDEGGYLTGDAFFYNLRHSVSGGDRARQVPQRRKLRNYEDGEYVFDVGSAVRANAERTRQQIETSRQSLYAMAQREYDCIATEIVRAESEEKEGDGWWNQRNAEVFDINLHTEANIYYTAAARRMKRIVSGEACFRRVVEELQQALRQSIEGKDMAPFRTLIEEPSGEQDAMLSYLIRDHYNFQVAFDSSSWDASEFAWEAYAPAVQFDWEFFQVNLPIQLQFIDRKGFANQMHWTYQMCVSRDAVDDVWRVNNYRLHKRRHTGPFSGFCVENGGGDS